MESGSRPSLWFVPSGPCQCLAFGEVPTSTHCADAKRKKNTTPLRGIVNSKKDVRSGKHKSDYTCFAPAFHAVSFFYPMLVSDVPYILRDGASRDAGAMPNAAVSPGQLHLSSDN